MKLMTYTILPDNSNNGIDMTTSWPSKKTGLDIVQAIFCIYEWEALCGLNISCIVTC